MRTAQPLSRWRGRWVLTGTLLALTLLGAFAVPLTLPPVYQSRSSVVLLASRAASRPNGGNPYLSFSQSLTLTAGHAGGGDWPEPPSASIFPLLAGGRGPGRGDDDPGPA